MKNKATSVLLAALIVLSAPLCLFAKDEAGLKIEKIIDFLAFGTGSPTGTYFPLGNAFANVWTQKSKTINVMTHSTRGSYENIELLRDHEINIAIAQSDTVISALTGSGKFTDRPYKDLSILMALYPEVIQIVVPANSDITTIADLKGKLINVGPRESGNILTAIELLTAMNINESEYTKVHLSYDEAIQAMEKQECDATIIIAGVPTKAIIELKKRIPIRIIDIPLQTVVEAVNRLSYLSAFTISKDVYGEDKNTSTVALMALLITNKELKENIGYELVKMIFDNIEYLQIIHERARDISIKNALRGINKEFLHKGSKRYIDEQTNSSNR